MEQLPPSLTWLAFTLFQFLRYAIPAGLLFLLFYGTLRHRWLARKIQQRFPKRQHIFQEIKYSFMSACVFATVAIGLYYATEAGWTKIYREITDYGWGYTLFSIVLLVVLHDAYFYWIHRLMHTRWLYRRVHRVHHHSHNPSPWTALSFHPLEALLEVGIIGLVFVMPLHPMAIFVYSTLSLGMNFMGHLGFEIFPAHTLKHPLLRWFNTSTHHNMHHEKGRRNYGLYFNIWDTWMGTNHPEYRARFEALHQRDGRREKCPERLEEPLGDVM
mgnify:FL=1